MTNDAPSPLLLAAPCNAYHASAGGQRLEAAGDCVWARRPTASRRAPLVRNGDGKLGGGRRAPSASGGGSARADVASPPQQSTVNNRPSVTHVKPVRSLPSVCSVSERSGPDMSSHLSLDGEWCAAHSRAPRYTTAVGAAAGADSTTGVCRSRVWRNLPLTTSPCAPLRKHLARRQFGDNDMLLKFLKRGGFDTGQQVVLVASHSGPVIG